MATINDFECSDPPICDPAYYADDERELCEHCNEVYHTDEDYCPYCEDGVRQFLHDKRGYSWEALKSKPYETLCKIAEKYI